MALNHSAKAPVIATIIALASILTGPVNAGAQTPGGVTHVPAFTKLPNSVIEQFKADPQGLLTTYASAGLQLSARARSLVLTDPSLVDLLINVAKSANDAQKAAIGAGMAEAARILAAVDPQLAARIQLAVAQSGSESLIIAFIAGSNATQTASTVAASTNFSASLNTSTGAGGASIAGPMGGFGIFGGSNGESNLGAASSSVSNAASAFGPPGSAGGGLTSSTSQSTSPSKSSL